MRISTKLCELIPVFKKNSHFAPQCINAYVHKETAYKVYRTLDLLSVL